MPALVLLNSVDVGMETVHTDGLQDWDAVQVSESERSTYTLAPSNKSTY